VVDTEKVVDIGCWIVDTGQQVEGEVVDIG